MKKILIVLPNQLFDELPIKDLDEILIYKHPHYYNSYKYNKKKILLHESSINYYERYLKDKGYKVKIANNVKLDKKTQYYIYDSADELKFVDKLKKSYEHILLDNPNFLLNRELHEEYRKKTDKFFFNAFYIWSKKKLDIIPKLISLDKENRETKIPENLKIPTIPKFKADEKYLEKSYVNKNYSLNYGTTDDFIFPVTHKSTKTLLKSFIDKKFKNFGAYQDVISQKDDYLFHSMLSSSLNIGLLNPSDVINEVLKAKYIPKNSLEGFIRQLFWREYQLYTYRYLHKEYMNDKLNYLKLNTKINKTWYTGRVGNEVIDKTIIKAFDNGYLHHIERLMVIGNYMVLSEIKPMDGFKWFMEFSIDSYEWVMMQNVLDMVFFISGGKTMRRPYLSSGNYLYKMSDYEKGEWKDDIDEKYKEFVNKRKKELYNFRYYIKF